MKALFIALFIFLSLAVPVLAQRSTVRLEGQVVCCAECWAEADRNKVEYGTAENLLKAKSCVEGGDPTLLAVRESEEKFKLYQLETARFRLPGKNWLEFVGKRVAVTGEIQTKKETSIIRVDSLEILAPSIAQREASSVVGREVELKLKDLSAVEQSLSSFKGRIVILNFWATYCIPCRKEMPDLAAIQNEYAALGVQVVGASADEMEDRAKVLQFIKQTRINFPVWMGATPADMMRFGVGTALPGTIVIGKDGRVAKVISGVVNKSDLKKQLEVMLASTVVAEEPKEKSESSASSRAPEVSSVPS
ncbi:MAG TPA: TlpA disulfide reductase family protein [Pyrinomonadaceae bacterium]